MPSQFQLIFPGDLHNSLHYYINILPVKAPYLILPGYCEYPPCLYLQNIKVDWNAFSTAYN